MNWFKSKKKEEPNRDCCFYKEVEYKNKIITIWAKKCYYILDVGNRISFETGWSVDGKGFYSTGTDIDNLQSQLQHQLKKAKESIDYELNEPEIMNRVKEIQIN